MGRRTHLHLVAILVITWFASAPATAADWPMWRFDGRRSAATPEQLPADLHWEGSSQQPAPRLAWPEDPRLHFDASLEPIVAGQTLLVASSRNDSLTAINTANGERRWRFFADAPIRFAPIAVNQRVYFGADDGVNLGAPDDRQDKHGTLWLDHPNVGGPSPKVSITVVGDNVHYFRIHSLTVAGDLPWVAASGCEGLTSLKVHVGQAAANQNCRVKLYFSEPSRVSEGERVFDVALQGEPVPSNNDRN